MHCHPLIRPITVAVATTLLLSGCMPRSALKERATRDEVRASWGAPWAVKPGAPGAVAERWIFTNAPDGGRETWFVNFDDGGKLVDYTQVLTEQRTQQIRAGQTQTEVEAIIGPSYYTMRFPFKPEELTHIYRYMTPNQPICFYVIYDNAAKVISTGTRNDRIGNPGLERPCL